MPSVTPRVRLNALPRKFVRLALLAALLPLGSLTAGSLMAQATLPAPATTSAPASAPATARAPEPTDQPIPRGGLANPNKGWMDRHAKLTEQARKGDIDVYFEGDSITDFWPRGGKAIWEKEYVPLKAGDFGVSADKTQHVLYRITHGELEGVNPKVVVLMIGTNNIRQGRSADTPEAVARGVMKIVSTFREKLPEAKVLVLSIFPRDGKPDSPARKAILATNKIVAQDVAEMKDTKVRYLDIYEKFLEPDGTLSKDVMPDALHPNAKGYQIWADAMRDTLQAMLGK